MDQFLGQRVTLTGDQANEIFTPPTAPDFLTISNDQRRTMEILAYVQNMQKYTMACTFAMVSMMKSMSERQANIEVRFRHEGFLIWSNTFGRKKFIYNIQVVDTSFVCIRVHSRQFYITVYFTLPLFSPAPGENPVGENLLEKISWEKISQCNFPFGENHTVLFSPGRKSHQEGKR